MKFAMAIDTKKCVGCSDCVVACQIENQVPLGHCRDWIREITKGKYPDLQMEIRSERCNQCSNAPCVRCCPTGASHYTWGGIVGVIKNKCMGCKACIASCPYNARYIHPTGYVDKCTFCIDRLKEGKEPACVSVCPTYAFTFGDLHNPRSAINTVLSKRKYRALKPEVGTDPHIFYLYS